MNQPSLKRRILIIDDEPEFAKVLAEYFKTYGYEVSQASHVDEAIKLFQKDLPKIVLLDFNMPLVTGERLLPLLQSLHPGVRAIVISGYLLEQVEDKFRGLGYYAYFEKGHLSLEALKDKVEEALQY